MIGLGVRREEDHVIGLVVRREEDHDHVIWIETFRSILTARSNFENCRNLFYLFASRYSRQVYPMSDSDPYRSIANEPGWAEEVRQRRLVNDVTKGRERDWMKDPRWAPK